MLLITVCWIDYWTGSELAFSIFYLAPIALISWYSGRPLGIVFSLLAAGMWYGADSLAGKVYSPPAIGYWNTCVRLGYFLIVNHLVSRVRRELHRVRRLSQRDFLTTGAYNRRHFSELAEAELERVERYGRPLSLAYIDLDNFKTVNDTRGHEVGDELLKTVVNLLTENLRKPDIVARIGGDEFLVLFPETDGDQVRPVMERILVRTREAMKARDLPVAMSVGVATCTTKLSLDDFIKVADRQMYVSKNGGKDMASYELCS